MSSRRGIERETEIVAQFLLASEVILESGIPFLAGNGCNPCNRSSVSCFEISIQLEASSYSPCRTRAQPSATTEQSEPEIFKYARTLIITSVSCSKEKIFW